MKLALQKEDNKMGLTHPCEIIDFITNHMKLF